MIFSFIYTRGKSLDAEQLACTGAVTGLRAAPACGFTRNDLPIRE
jgi:hypothetical protein